ncbi:hypothetical protein BKA70DRAFT_1230742 [Coprinopsis sp. MPI-PUGE-AT-0042]|nr:hypothetical protein BKA70DRAFT_1230742 [Coprinopsis sp. MPI-PUGE-AT-0042]
MPKRQRSPSDSSVLPLSDGSGDDGYEDVSSHPSTPPRAPKRRKAAQKPLPFQDSLKAAQSASKPAGGDQTTRDMLARLAAQTSQKTVSLASQETNKGLQKPSTRMALSSKAKSSKSKSIPSSSSSSQRGNKRGATLDKEEPPIYIGSITLLPLGVTIPQYSDENMSGAEGGGLEQLLRQPYVFETDPPKSLDNSYLDMLVSCGLYFEASDPRSLIPFPPNADHQQLAHILAQFLPVPFKYLNTQFRFSDADFPSPFLLVYKNRYDYSIVGGSLPSASDITRCFHKNTRIAAADKMLILVSVDKIPTKMLLKWRKELASSSSSQVSLKPTLCVAASSSSSSTIPPPLPLSCAPPTSYEESRNSSIEDALRSDGDEEDEEEVAFLSTRPSSPPAPSSAMPLRPTRVAKTAANTALELLMTEEAAEGEGSSGSTNAFAPLDVTPSPPVPEAPEQEETAQESLTRANSPNQEDISHLSTSLHSHLSFSEFPNPWGTQRELDFDL